MSCTPFNQNQRSRSGLNDLLNRLVYWYTSSFISFMYFFKDKFSQKTGNRYCSVSASGDPLMSCSPLPKAAKPVWDKQLTRLPCLVVYAKFQFHSKFFRKAFWAKGTGVYENHYGSYSERLNMAVLQGRTFHAGCTANDKR